MTDRKSLLLLHVLHRIMPAAAQINPALMTLIVARAVHLSLRQGNAPVSAYFCACFAHVQVVMGEVQKAYEIGQIAIRLNQTIGSQAVACTVHFMLGAFVAFWSGDISESVEHLRKGLKAALDVGDYLYACYCAMGQAVFAFQMGDALEDVAEVARNAADLIDRTGDVTNRDVVSSLRRVVDRLRASAGAALGPDDTEVERRIVESRNPFVISCHFLFLALEKYLAGDLAGTSACLARSKPSVPGNFNGPQTQFFEALLLAEQARAGGENAGAALAELKSEEATLPPVGRGITQDLRPSPRPGCGRALRREWRRRPSAHPGSSRPSSWRAMRAQSCSRRWPTSSRAGTPSGGVGLRSPGSSTSRMRSRPTPAGALSERPGNSRPASWSRAIICRLPPSAPPAGQASCAPTTSTPSRSAKATQALSGEIVLAKLMARLMEIAVAQAGAERGFLLLLRNGELWVECAAGPKAEGFTRLRFPADAGHSDEGRPSDESGAPLPRTIVDFVWQAREKVVLTQTSEPSRFSSDPYLAEHKPQSLLCLPMVRQGELMGILYLENRLTADVFTSDQVELLEMLSTQAAISIENARLYEEMEARVQDRTRKLEESLRTIQDGQAKIVEAERRAAVAHLESELAIAHRIQTSILPRVLSVPGMEIAAAMQTATEVGGDYYDLLPTADGGFWLGIGDVSGHGLNAGLVMLMLQSGLASLMRSDACVDPAEAALPTQPLDLRQRPLSPATRRLCHPIAVSLLPRRTLSGRRGARGRGDLAGSVTAVSSRSGPREPGLAPSSASNPPPATSRRTWRAET